MERSRVLKAHAEGFGQFLHQKLAILHSTPMAWTTVYSACYVQGEQSCIHKNHPKHYACKPITH